MGWALTYAISLKRPLTNDEQEALEGWSRDHGLRLSSTRGEAFEAWKGLLPDERIAELKRSQQKQRRAGRDEDADYGGFIQVRTLAQFKRLVRQFQALEALLPVAEIRLSDDHYLRDSLPSEVDLSAPLVPSAEEPVSEPTAPLRSPEVPPPATSADPDDALADEVAAALEKARREFERWKKSNPD